MRDTGPSPNAGKPVPPCEAIIESSDDGADYVLRFEPPANKMAHQAAVTPLSRGASKARPQLRLVPRELALEGQEPELPAALDAGLHRSRWFLLGLALGLAVACLVAAAVW
jgi:hypothetical protein